MINAKPSRYDLAQMPLFTLFVVPRAAAATEQFGFSSHASADAVAAPQESSKTKAMPQSRDEPRKLLGNNRLPKLVVALGRFASPGNGCLARRQARQRPLWTSAPAAPTVGQRSGSLQALQRPQTGQLRPAHKRQPRGSAGDAPVRRTHPLILRQPKPP